MRGGEVSESGGIVTVSPVTIVQNGQITDIDVALSVALPPNLAAPYFIALSISSPIENLGEVITPIFIKRPQEVNNQVTLVAEYDGQEWRPLPRLQIQERIRELETQNVRSSMVGVTSGFNVAYSSGTFDIDAGTLIAADGTDVSKDEAMQISAVDAPSAGSIPFNRIDSIVFRKPADHPARIGMMELVVGPTFSATTGTATETAVAFGADPSSMAKVRVHKNSGRTTMAFLEDGDLKFFDYTDAGSVSAPQLVATSVDEYDFVEDFDGYLDFVYQRNTDLFHKRVTHANAVIVAETQLYTSIKTLHSPAIECVGIPTNYQIHIAVCKEMTGTAREIGYVRLASDGSLITPYTQWINLTSQLVTPTFAKDDQDSMLYMAFADDDTGQAYLRAYDASTATASTPPVQVGLPVQLQDDTHDMVSDTAMPTTGVRDLRVIRTANKETFVFWQHFRALGQYSVAIYNARYKSMFGHKAVILDNNDISQYDVKVDGMNFAYIVKNDDAGANTLKDVFNLETLARVGTSDTIYSGTVTDCALGFGNRGELIHLITESAGGQYFRSTAAVQTTLREQFICPTDVYVAYYRLSDEAVAVSDNLVGEELAVRRLYEFTNMFGASGVISWNTAGANKLVTSAITIRFLNRDKTLTINAVTSPGVTIPLNSAIYVEIPDEDVAATLTMKVTPFGQGMLDRNGKRALPLFWNIGGRLYSNFAPYSFSQDGETVVIGGTVSEEMIAWLGSGDSSPDASNHGYGSTSYILESDSIVTAIGKLDAAQAGVVASGTANVIPLTMGNTSISVVFGTPRSTAFYRLVATLENIVGPDPMFQPIMITAKDASGFTVSWPSPLDSGDYQMDYILRDTV